MRLTRSMALFSGTAERLTFECDLCGLVTTEQAATAASEAAHATAA
jgi:hypothetical protein